MVADGGVVDPLRRGEVEEFVRGQVGQRGWIPDAGHHQQLRAEERTAAENDSSVLGELEDRGLAVDDRLDSSCFSASTLHALDLDAALEREVGAGERGCEVGLCWTTTLTFHVGIVGSAEDAILLVWVAVDCDALEAGTVNQPLLRSVEASLHVTLSIGRRSACEGLLGLDFLDGTLHVLRLPVCRVVSVKVGRRRLNEQLCVDGRVAADSAASEATILFVTAQEIRVAGEDGAVQAWCVDTGQVCVVEPFGSLTAAGAVVRSSTLFEKKCSLASFTHSVGCDDACRSGTDNDRIPFDGLLYVQAGFEWSGGSDVQEDSQGHEGFRCERHCVGIDVVDLVMLPPLAGYLQVLYLIVKAYSDSLPRKAPGST